ncbi:MAG: GIDE domain-containing protein [Thermostichales cyanobacterium DRC_bins_46]
MSGWVIAGLLAAGAAVASFVEYVKLQQLIRQLQRTKVCKARELQALAVGKSPPWVQVTGKILCPQPLLAELSQQRCVYYETEVAWDYEETRYCRRTLDDQGNVIREEYLRDRPQPTEYSYGFGGSLGWQPRKEGVNVEKKQSRFDSSLNSPTTGYTYTEGGYTYWVVEEKKDGSETLHKMTRSTPFYLKDETGQVRVDVTGGEVEAVVSVNEETMAPSANVLTVSYGNFSLNLSNYASSSGEGYRKPRGFTYKESLLPVDTVVSVTGQVLFEGGKPVLRKPPSGGRLLVSLQSGNELLEKKQQDAQVALGTSITGLIVGVVCLMVGLRR